MKPIKMNKLLSSENRPGAAPNEEPVEGARGATGAGSSLGGEDNIFPNPEVPEKKLRRNFTASYKLRILQKADLCTESGQSLLPEFLRMNHYQIHMDHISSCYKNNRQHSIDPQKNGEVCQKQFFGYYINTEGSHRAI